MTDTQTIDAIKRIESKIDRIISILEFKFNTAPKITVPTVSDSPALYDYLDTWLNDTKAPTIKPKSLAILRSGIEHYIKPNIPNKPIATVRSSEMLHAIENVPHSYMRQVVYSIFRSVFKRAYQLDIIAENPAAKLDFVKHTRQKGKALTLDEQAVFVKAVENDTHRDLWLFLLLSGCRVNEALTLLWTDIDREIGRVYIRGTKTESARRYIPLFPQLAELFDRIPHTDERVFPRTYRSVQCAFYRVRRKSGLQFRIHDLRHTFATRCLESGIAIKTVSLWLGHKHTNTTADIYSHMLTEFERQEADKFNPKL